MCVCVFLTPILWSVFYCGIQICESSSIPWTFHRTFLGIFPYRNNTVYEIISPGGPEMSEGRVREHPGRVGGPGGLWGARGVTWGIWVVQGRILGRRF